MISWCGWGKFVEGKKQDEEGRGITRALTRLETLMEVKYNIKCNIKFNFVEEPFWGTSWFSLQTDDYFVHLAPFYSLVQCHEVSSTPILQFPAKSVLHPFLYQLGNQLLSANRMLT